jgi:hypothetical protein
MSKLFNIAENWFMSAAVLLGLLILTYGLLSLGKKLPAPLGTAASWASDHASPDGWS